MKLETEDLQISSSLQVKSQGIRVVLVTEVNPDEFVPQRIEGELDPQKGDNKCQKKENS